jgi:hypothetical protein
VNVEAQAILNLVTGVTRKWCKQRKAEERQASRALRRREALVRSERVTIKDAASAVMEEAYRKTSSEGKYPAHARQVMYAARPEILIRTGRDHLDDQYFCQTLLPDYLNDNPHETANWDVVFDARGHFEEPHTKLIVPLGTLDVREYVGDIELRKVGGALEIKVMSSTRFPTQGPAHRFGAILFIEKEGFLPLFKAVRLAERYDLAIMSTKGMSVTASRLLVDQLCGRHDIPLLVLHDFDKSGFSILGTLQRDTRRYSFANAIRVIDLGLRLEDVEQWQLESEAVMYGKSDPRPNLSANGATEEEVAVLCDEERSSHYHFVGQRVELNAFTSEHLVTWIEAGLKRHGVKKVVPDAPTLEAAFRRAAVGTLVNRRVAAVVQQAQEEAVRLKVPRRLARQVRSRLEADPDLPWDAVVAGLAAEQVERD